MCEKGAAGSEGFLGAGRQFVFTQVKNRQVLLLLSGSAFSVPRTRFAGRLAGKSASLSAN